MLSPRAHLQWSIAALLQDMTRTKHTAHNPEAPKKQLPEEEEMESSTTPSTSKDDEKPFYNANLHHETVAGDQLPEEGDGGES